MLNKKSLYSIALVSAAIILMLVSIAGAAQFAYIPDSSNSISVIDTATNTVTTTIPIGLIPFGVSVSPDGAKVYVTNLNSNSVSVINTTTNVVSATAPVGSGPRGVSVSPDGTKVYSVNSFINSVSVINTTTNAITATIPVGSGPIGVSVLPDGTKVYVANFNSNSVSVINTTTNTVTATVPVGSGPFGVSVNPTRSEIYVTNQNSNSVSVINATTSTVTVTVPVGSGPRGVSVYPDGTKVYVTNYLSNSVSVIDTETNSVTATVPVGSGPFGVSVTPDGTKVYVANFNSNFVTVINTTTNTVAAIVPVGNNPSAFGQFIGSPFPVITLNKFASPINYNSIGQNVTYNYTVTNFGNVGIVGLINVTDNKTGTFTISNSGLASGQSVTGTANYTISQSDLDNGSVTNAAFATGIFNGIEIKSANVTATVTATQNPALLTVKIASPINYSIVGQNITYNYTVTNSGNVGITGLINIADNKTGTFTISNSGLAPGQSVTGTANYTISQSDLDNGSVTNAAFATGTFNGIEIKSADVTATVIANQNPALLTVKIASPMNYNAVGQNVTYSYTVTNFGNVGITGLIKVTDNKTGTFTISNSGLAPGQSVTGTANYTISQSDLDNGSVTNAAFATGTFNGIEIKSANVTATVTATQNPALTITKTAIPTTYNAVGQNITYNYTVTNSGNVGITGLIKVTDNKTGTFTISNSGLVPGQKVTGTTNYTISQSDLDNGSVTNAAFATGTFNGIEIKSANVTATVTAIQKPALTITKTAIPTTYNTIGQKILYVYTVTNSRNVPVSGIVVTDNKATVKIQSGTLAPGSSFKGVAIYTITRADINAGSVTNSAFATGTLNGKKVTSNQVTVIVKYKK